MLTIRNLVKVYPGPVAALQGVELDIENGMFGLLGPNGAGKTTLMRIVAGLLEPTSGAVWLDGEEITAHPEKVWPKLGYLPQEFGFYPHLTGEQMLSYLLRMKGVTAGPAASGEKAGGRGPGATAGDAGAGEGQAGGASKSLCASLLDQVNLTFAAKRKVRSYSGGMRQRLGIAQAIAGNPRLIIVDEPTAGLDPEERLRLYRLLTELAAERIVLLSTHIVEDVAVLCPRFAVIREGRLIADTSPSRARQALSGMIFEGEVSAEELRSLQTARCVTAAILVEGRNRVRVYEPDGAAPAGFTSVAPTLEDAYLVMMRAPAARKEVPVVQVGERAGASL